MAIMGSLFGGEMSAGSDIYDITRDHTLKFMAIYHKQIAADLRALARDGIVGPADFGGLLGGVPKNIEAMFGDATPQRQLCG